MNIDMNKKHKVRNTSTGEEYPARVLCTDLTGDNLPVVVYFNGYFARFSSEGFSAPDFYQLIEVLSYEDFKIGEPVMVRFKGNATWHKRYFAGATENGWPTTFDSGATAWSTHGATTTWDECRRPTEEELKCTSLEQ